jgi:serine/threonine-protein kinase PpkA
MAQEPSKKVLVIEDEPSIRNNIMLMLKVERYSASGAENGRVGLEMARRDPPDLILCDVMMPEVDGFAVLEALRADPRLSEIPFIFLTALDDRSSMRRGMNLGADDYLPKPFTRDELLEAVNSRLKKYESLTQTLAARLVPQQDRLTQKFREKIAGGDGGLALEEADAANLTGKIAEATVLFSDIRNFTTYSERLTNAEIAELLNAYLQIACSPIIRCGGLIMKFIGDGVMALFEPRKNETAETHARRAVRAGLAMQLAALDFRKWITEHHPSRDLPEFAVGVGIHSGEVLLCHVGAPGRGELTAIGDSVNIASRLEGQTKELGWAVVASESTVKAAGASVVIGARQKVQLRGRSLPTEAFEIIGIAAGDAEDASVQIPEDMRQALAANSKIAADAAKAALGMTLRMITAEFGDALAEKRLTVLGYRLLSMIGRGGSSVVYLAERESDGQQVVLKILNAIPGQNETMLQRFVQEFDIISSIDHPSVVKIYDRGFGEHQAYIAMEYFPGGSLTEVIANGLTGRQALSLLAQAGAALREIHARGIIHRDIKPANLMARADGSIALADFGIAKRLGDDLGRTRHGELYGTPYYVSPEQIEGQPATAQSDIYALGIIFYEMLMRRRPFDADSVSGLIALHVNAPRPKLPENLSEYQQLMDKMLDVNPARRYRSADELLHGIDEVWTQQALRALQTQR